MLASAKFRTMEKLAFDPNRGMLKVILTQIEFIENCVQNGARIPTVDESAQITIGAIAVKNLQEEDQEYATWLSEISYAFRKNLKYLPS